MVTVIVGAIFLYCVVMIAQDDLAFRIVPDRFLVPLFATGAVYAFLNPGFPGESALDIISRLAYRSAILGILGLAAALFYRLLRGREGLGLGDIKLMAAAGIWLPPLESFHAITAASVAALIAMFAAALLRRQAFALTHSLPFAVFSWSGILASVDN